MLTPLPNALSRRALLATVTALLAAAPAFAQTPAYGNDPARGAYAQVNGIKLYCEDHGSGPAVVVQLHGNSGDIASMAPQIAGLAPHFRVIAVDSRAHGKSEVGSVPLNYGQMAEDVNALLDQLQQKQVNVLGWSDGGMLGLLLAIKHPYKVGKLAIMGANLNPADAHEWALAWVAREVEKTDRMIAANDATQPWRRNRQLLNLLGQQPNIPVADLRQITAPTLVMAGDKDIIRGEHTLQIFENIPKAQRALFAGATHFIPAEDPRLFNAAVLTFFQRPFKRPESKTALE